MLTKQAQQPTTSTAEFMKTLLMNLLQLVEEKTLSKTTLF
jgi:hypothetical protein